MTADEAENQAAALLEKAANMDGLEPDERLLYATLGQGYATLALAIDRRYARSTGRRIR